MKKDYCPHNGSISGTVNFGIEQKTEILSTRGESYPRQKYTSVHIILEKMKVRINLTDARCAEKDKKIPEEKPARKLRSTNSAGVVKEAE